MDFTNKLVKFGAVWCQPCKQADSYLKKFPEHLHESVDVADNEDLATKFTIRNVPTFILFDKDGNESDRFVGFNPTKITQAMGTLQS